MAHGPAAGLALLDAVGAHPQLSRWAHLHAARAELLRRDRRHDDAAAAYRTALRLMGPTATRSHIEKRLHDLTAEGTSGLALRRRSS